VANDILLQMRIFTTLPYDVFMVLVSRLKRFQLVYYGGWTSGSIIIEDQLLLTLMKLTMNCKDGDLALRFNVSRRTVSNIVNTLISALYELLLGHSETSLLLELR